MWKRVEKYLGRSRTQFNSFVSQEDLKKLIQSTNRVVDAKWYELAGLSANFVILTKEQETIGFLVDCFKFTEIKLQYYVAGKYKIDMYLPQFNIAIECDEFNHENRNIVDEVIRQLIIEKELGCKFIRFNPDSSNFKIQDVIRSINEQIMFCLQSTQVAKKNMEEK